MEKVSCFCESCESNFIVQHDLDPHRYTIEHCPFCGDALEEEMLDEYQEEDEE